MLDLRRPPVRAYRYNYRTIASALHAYPLDPAPDPPIMRSFVDEDGSHWQAALMQASFGNVLMVFSRIGADGVLKKPLDAANMPAAEQLLADADEKALRTLLRDAVPWN